MRRLVPSVFVSAAVAAGLLLSFTTSGSGTPGAFTVDTTIDSVDANPGNGVCGDSEGACSLRAAVMETNALPGANVINLPAGLYRLTIAEAGVVQDSAPYGDLDLNDDVTIAGEGAWTTTIQQRAQFNRIAETAEGVVVNLSGVTVKGGNTVGYPDGPDATGGGILNKGTLTIDGVTLKGNSAGRAAYGGGIGNYGHLTVLNSTISNNYAVYDGTGIHGGDVTVVNSTISGNYGEFGGMAGIWAGSANLRNATVANNEGFNLFVGIGALTLVNTIVSAEEGDQNCYLAGYGAGPIFSLGHNIDSDGTCRLTGAEDLSGVDPQLQRLASNGGPTLTHALSPNSPAIDAGDNAQCPDTDQRGVPRPVGPGCDIGAFEYGGSAETPVPTPTTAPFARADLNCNHVVDSFDAALVLIHITFGGGIFSSCGPPTAAPIERGDIDCSSAITSVDALMILRHVARLPLALPPDCPPLE